MRADGLQDNTLKALLLPMVAGIDATLAAGANGIFERDLGGYPVDEVPMSLVLELRRASNRIGKF